MVTFNSEAVLARAREVQEAVMVDTCQVHRSSGRTFDKETGRDVEAWDLVYEGRCRVPRRDATTRVEITGETITPAGPMVLVPWNTEPIRPDDRVTVGGRVLWVTDVSPRTFDSARHLSCREVR
ncbi:DUF6093 family protein [Dermabacteraceae bacterium P7006]